MPSQDKIENQLEGESGAGSTGAGDNLTGARGVDGKAVQAVQKLNPNRRNSTSDIPVPGTTGKPGSGSGFSITDGSQVIASKHVTGQTSESVHGVPTTVGPDGIHTCKSSKN